MSVEKKEQPKFIADTMLGKLARWMSLLGYDIIYSGIIDDAELIHQAQATKRIIITRDTKLINSHPEVAVLIIKSTERWEQLREVIQHYPMNFAETAFSRCQYCNVEIEEVDKKKVIERLPPLVREAQEKIYQCPQCGKLYWSASHVDHIRSLLKEHLNVDLD